MDGYQRRTEKKKENIRKAAFELFATYGVEKVSVAEIAKKANVSPVTIYNYFGSKEDLTKSVIEEFFNTEMEKFNQIINADISYPKKVEKILFDRMELTKSISTDFIKSITDPGIQKLIEEWTNTKAMPAMMELIEQGRHGGYIHPNITTEAILLYFHIFTEAIQHPELFANVNKQTIIDIGHLFFYGLVGQPKKD
ncbi:TetR/AcrR family transcriptional regulator [Bacillus sp. FJAT-49736]|uniref:TetR/AcrR family transcriptional regulator n=1 Tax=Bacillus sp. FJAT-49736 TaxID=2833582 RepID=UPI001BC93883|nr:TetR/AcrR family transcriptional regulator [Bacillus sp. FJAT-49736]MBS4174614.1 TetR/AcrR family transcriptional regulator [Bacillus sp. FJAT-49736]